ncbi:hypothetical protein D3C73_1275830 [compost metagenome]
MPGKKAAINLVRCLAFMGTRSVRNCLSSFDGGGITSRQKTKKKSGNRKTSPVRKGIQLSLTPTTDISVRATVLTKPEAKIKLIDINAPINSVVLRPSK